jgi:hypothetical protein
LFSFGLLWLFDSAKTYVELVLTFIHFSKFSLSAIVLPLYLHLQIKKNENKTKAKTFTNFLSTDSTNFAIQKIKKKKEIYPKVRT